ncbi:hypothetical protein D3C87_1805180 [compost metagenome]
MQAEKSLWNTWACGLLRDTRSISRWLPPCIHAPGPGEDGLLARLECDQVLTMAMASPSRLSEASSSASETFIG